MSREGRAIRSANPVSVTRVPWILRGNAQTSNHTYYTRGPTAGVLRSMFIGQEMWLRARATNIICSFGGPPLAAKTTSIQVRPTPTARGMRILLVDDDQDAATLLADSLRVLGHDVVVTHDGPTALAAAAEQQPNVALLDLGLPVMDGFEAADRLRGESPASDLLLIAVTGRLCAGGGSPLYHRFGLRPAFTEARRCPSTRCVHSNERVELDVAVKGTPACGSSSRKGC